MVDSRAKTIKALNKLLSKSKESPVPDAGYNDDDRLFEMEMDEYVSREKNMRG